MRRSRRFLMIGAPSPPIGLICRRAAAAILYGLMILLHFSCFARFRYKNWSETWLLTCNASKCKAMQNERKRNVNYHLGNGMDIVNLRDTEMEKDLGV